MAGDLHEEFVALEQELAAIAVEWSRIDTVFAGSAPEMPCSPTEWAEATELNLIYRADGADEGLPGFAAAWQETVGLARDLFFDRFTSWATRVVETVGTERFRQLNIPDPPIHEVPLTCRGTTTAEVWLTGAADIGEAGCRIIFWAAVYRNPAGLQRSLEGQDLVWRWAGRVVDFLAFDKELDGPHERGLFGRCYPARGLMAWAAQGFLSLSKGKTAEMGSGYAAATGLPPPPPVYYMEKRGKHIVVNFGGETGIISGVDAFRLHKLVVQERIGPLELGGDLDAATASASFIESPEVEPTDFDSMSVASGRYIPRDEGELRELRARSTRLQQEVQEAETDAERNDSQALLEQIQQEIKEKMRLHLTQVGKARAKIERGFRSLEKRLALEMPLFSRHIKQSKSYDEIGSQFIYNPQHRPDWEFHNFG